MEHVRSCTTHCLKASIVKLSSSFYLKATNTTTELQREPAPEANLGRDTGVAHTRNLTFLASFRARGAHTPFWGGEGGRILGLCAGYVSHAHAYFTHGLGANSTWM